MNASHVCNPGNVEVFDANRLLENVQRQDLAVHLLTRANFLECRKANVLFEFDLHDAPLSRVAS
jgi:hypothetical protein